MISFSRAYELIDSVEYKDWVIMVPETDMMTVAGLHQKMMIEAAGRVPVLISYVAHNSEEGRYSEKVTNAMLASVPLTETEAEFARALYEAIRVVEEHESREFFKIGNGRIDGRTVEKRSRAVFHPHGVNRNAMFHDLDPFAKRLRLQDMTGSKLTADAVA